MKLLALLLLSATSLFAGSPDYLIIGAQKAGTTALHRFLNQHPLALGPNENVPRSGEIHYFDDNFDKGEAWYQACFFEKPTPDYITGDKSPYYLFHPLVAKRVYDLYPHIKLIIVLRNPIDRAYSHYWFNVRLGNEPLKSFEKALSAETERLANEEEKFYRDPLYQSTKHRFFSYLARSRYVEQLKRWLAYFPLEQIHIVDAADLRDQPQETLNDVFAFLDLPPFDITPLPDKHKDYPPMRPETRARLKAYFQPYNQALEALLNRKFSW